MSILILSILLYSDHSYGYGGHDQHSKSLDREPSEVRPFSRRHFVPCIWRDQPWWPDPHPDRGGLPALQLPAPAGCFRQVLLHHDSLWGVQEKEKVRVYPNYVCMLVATSPPRHTHTHTASVPWQCDFFLVQDSTLSPTLPACLMVTCGRCTWNTGAQWRTAAWILVCCILDALASLSVHICQISVPFFFFYIFANIFFGKFTVTSSGFSFDSFFKDNFGTHLLTGQCFVCCSVPGWFETQRGDLQPGVWGHSEQSAQSFIGKKTEVCHCLTLDKLNLEVSTQL